MYGNSNSLASGGHNSSTRKPKTKTLYWQKAMCLHSTMKLIMFLAHIVFTKELKCSHYLLKILFLE